MMVKPGLAQMLYSSTHMATVGVKGLSVRGCATRSCVTDDLVADVLT